VLDWNCEFLDDILKDFVVWRVYHKLFKLHNREVDLKELQNRGYCEVDKVTTKRGGFMGDPLSFTHLTLQMAATVNAATYLSADRGQDRHARPLGQCAGDDQLLIGASCSFYKELRYMFDNTNMIVSKIDSWSPDSMTFCEQYAIKPIDSDKYINYGQDSIFADLFYLDIIKGSLLSGKSKVKTVGAIPLIGHSRMLNKQVKWHPIEWVQRRAPKLLWAANYDKAAKLSSAMASLPPRLGGIDMAIGRVILFEDSLFQKRLPYYEAILKLPQEEFLSFSILLQGIYKANPKGVTWDNSPELFKELLNKIQVLTEEEYQTLNVPLALVREGHAAIRRFVRHELGFVSFREIIDELTRRDAFVKMWHEILPTTYLTLPLKEPKLRASKAWKYIYETVKPVSDVSSTSIEEVAGKYDLRTWGLYVSTEDPAIAELFDGMPSLSIDYGGPT
jgi:hypothetical protein